VGDIIMFDAPEAAKPHTVHGWLARDGRFYDDEGAARYAGCTHCPCEECGAPAPKSYIRCDACRAKASADRYAAMPAAPWDGKQMVYSETTERYYASPDDAWDEEEDCEDLADLRLVLCEPCYVPQLDLADFADELPEDGEAPDELLQAIDAFNAATKGVLLSWWPGKTRLSTEAPHA
jgi:hypothetical protein